MDRNFWRAFGLFVGGVIGVGVFGLPAALQAAGVGAFLAQVVIVGVLAWWMHRCVVDVVQATGGRHRIPGYARLLLPPWAARLAGGANVLGLFGALVAYLLAGGSFVHLLFEGVVPLPPAGATILFLLPGSLLLLWGLRALPTIELAILALFLLVLGVLPFAARDAFSAQALTQVPAWPGALIPYGVLLFSFWGVSLIPETFELAGRSRRRSTAVLAAGLVTAALSYVLFAVLVSGVTGEQTTEDALTGLRETLGGGALVLALVFGILTTFSSYLALALTLLRTFVVDARLPRLLAWSLTVGAPLSIALLTPSLLAVLAFTGAVFLGIEGLAIVAMWWRVAGRARRARRLSTLVAAGLLVLGVVSELLRRFLI